MKDGLSTLRNKAVTNDDAESSDDHGILNNSAESIEVPKDCGRVG